MSYCATHDVEWEDEVDDEGNPAGEALNHNEEAGCDVQKSKPKDKSEDFPATKTSSSSSSSSSSKS
jgi:hypothetical protein